MKRNILVGSALIAALVLVWWYRGRGSTQPEPGHKAGATRITSQKSISREQPRGVRNGPAELSLLMDDDPEGTLRLEGQVVDEHESGVAGATVVVDTNPPRVTTSEDDGTFSFDKLVGRSYRLQARAPSGVAGPLSASLTATSDPVILRLRPGGAVDVRVIDALQKSPIAGATVELRGLDTQTANTDGDGNARIERVVPGGYRLVASAPGYAMQHAWVRVPASPATASVALALRRGAAVGGRVVSMDGEPVAGASVLYAGASEWAQEADPRRDAVVTGTAGEFRFDALPAGSFRFVARHPDHAPGTSELITLDGVTELGDVTITMEAAAVLRGKVVSQIREPVSAAQVRVVVKSDGIFAERPRQAFSGSDGMFEIRGLARKQLELVALHQSGSSEIVDVDMRDLPHEREVELILDLTDAISGVVVDTAGEPVEGAQVSAFPDRRGGGGFNRSEWRLRGLASELSDAGGRFTIRGLRPGAYDIRASPAGTTSRFGNRMREPTPAHTGDTDVRIVLDADGAIKGKVAFAGGDVPEMFTISTGGFRGGTPFATSDGSFEVRDLPPRTYVITVRGMGFESKQVSNVVIESGNTRDLGTIIVRRGRSISGRVTSGGAPVAGARVRAGRMVFGDGTSSSAQRRGPPGAAGAKETTTDQDGSFIVSGLTPGNVSIVAEHDQLGRSPALLVAMSDAQPSVAGIELKIQPYGALQGTVTRAVEPVANVIVNVQSQAAYGVQYSVQTGTDGTYRFDQLAPDTYKLSAVVGSPRSGMGSHSRTVTVTSQQTTTADIAIEEGRVSLTVNIQPKNADSLGFAFVRLVGGAISATTASQLDAAVAALGDAFSSRAFSFEGRPQTFDNLQPGGYSVCVTPMPADLDRRDSFAYFEREGYRLPVFCRRVAVTDAPDAQSVTVIVEVPAYVPAADESGAPENKRM